jgi:hypothetical protein
MDTRTDSPIHVFNLGLCPFYTMCRCRERVILLFIMSDMYAVQNALQDQPEAFVPNLSAVVKCSLVRRWKGDWRCDATLIRDSLELIKALSALESNKTEKKEAKKEEEREKTNDDSGSCMLLKMQGQAFLQGKHLKLCEEWLVNCNKTFELRGNRPELVQVYQDILKFVVEQKGDTLAD